MEDTPISRNLIVEISQVKAELITRNKVEIFKALLASEDAARAPINDSDRWRVLELAGRMYDQVKV